MNTDEGCQVAAFQSALLYFPIQLLYFEPETVRLQITIGHVYFQDDENDDD